METKEKVKYLMDVYGYEKAARILNISVQHLYNIRNGKTSGGSHLNMFIDQAYDNALWMQTGKKAG